MSYYSNYNLHGQHSGYNGHSSSSSSSGRSGQAQSRPNIPGSASSKPLVKEIKDKIPDPMYHKIPSKLMEKHYERILELKKIRERVTDPNELKKMNRVINKFVMQYLRKGAIHPITENLNTPISGLSHIKSKNSSYYRGSGNDLTKILEEMIANKYPKIFENRDNVFLIKSEKFKMLLKGGNEENDWIKINVNDDVNNQLKEFENKLIEFCEKNYNNKGYIKPVFFDVSSILAEPSSFYKGDVDGSIQRRMSQINEIIKKCNEKLDPKKIINFPVTIGGFVKLNPGDDYGVTVICHRPNNVDDVKAGRNIGYHPDIVQVENALREEFGFTLETAQSIIEAKMDKLPDINTPDQNEVTFENVQQTFKTTVELLKGLINESKDDNNQKAVNLYANVYVDFLNNISDEINKGYNNKKITNADLMVIANALSKIQDIAGNQKDLNFTKFITEDIELIIEEITLLNEFVPKQNLNKITAKLANIADFKDSEVVVSSYSYTSGMNALVQIFDTLYKSNDKNNLDVVFSNMSFFEVLLKLQKFNQRHFKFDKQAHDEFKKREGSRDPYKTGRSGFSRYDVNFLNKKIDLRVSERNVIFTDLYPNDVRKEMVDKIPITELVKVEDIEKRSEESPLTLIIDTTTTIFYDKEVQEVVKHYKKVIEEGKLNLILLNSLEKFSMLGADKFSGGVAITYNKGSNFEKFNEKLMTKSIKETISQEAEKCFSTFLSQANRSNEAKGKDAIRSYLDQVNANCETFYQILKQKEKSGEFTYFKIQEKGSDGIPVLGIHFEGLLREYDPYLKSKNYKEREDSKSKLTEYLVNLIYARSQETEMPLTSRMSFGFPTTNINDCIDAIRFGVGLGNKEYFENYAKILADLDKEIANLSPREKDDFFREIKNSKLPVYESYVLKKAQMDRQQGQQPHGHKRAASGVHIEPSLKKTKL